MHSSSTDWLILLLHRQEEVFISPQMTRARDCAQNPPPMRDERYRDFATATTASAPLYGCKPTPIHYAIMERAQETHARQLYNKLISNIGPVNPDAEITASGVGVNWRCFVRLAQDTCVVQRFDQRGPECLTSFQREGEELATARTSSSDEHRGGDMSLAGWWNSAVTL